MELIFVRQVQPMSYFRAACIDQIILVLVYKFKDFDLVKTSILGVLCWTNSGLEGS
jgi:hypothetical protein